jgi:hypothetical protein
MCEPIRYNMLTRLFDTTISIGVEKNLKDSSQLAYIE